MTTNLSYIGLSVECPNGIVGTINGENETYFTIKDNSSDDQYLFTKTSCKLLGEPVVTTAPNQLEKTKEEQHQELIDTLKFTPRTYRVEIWGRGGEVYWGKVDRKIYDFFKEKEIDIEQYAGSWEERMWDDVPFDMQPFSPGSPYECDDVHTSGATFDDSSTIVVYDETGAQIWTSPLGTAVLEENGATSDCIDERYINDYPDGTVVFWGAQGEKGTFFGNDFELRAPFDPSKLRILYEDMDGWEIVTGVQYNSEDIDGNDYDTTGKWGENKWIIVGGEPPYQGVERDEEDYEDTSDDDEEITLDDDDVDSVAGLGEE